jgi:iron-sulfur cluster repair protein YtfE (RIC family)
MQPSEVRRSVLSDHQKLREQLTKLEQLARAALVGTQLPTAALRGEAKVLLESLVSHMSWEDRYLAPVLLEADAWGDLRCAQLAEDHREQRNLLEYALRQLHDEGRPESIVAGNLLDLVALLRDDMNDEESALLDEGLLRDDVVGVDVFSG